MRTPVILQLSETECGAACLGIVLAHHGRWADADELREACCVGRDGSTAADVVRAAREYGLEATGWRRGLADLADVPLPAVLFWGFNHFVVLEEIRKSAYSLNDPATGRRTVGEDEFDEKFTGVVLTMTPGADFERVGNRPGIVRELLPWLRDVKAPLFFAAVCGLIMAIPGLALPALLSVFIDQVISGRQSGWGPPLVGAAVALGVASCLSVWLQLHCLNRLAVRLSVERSERFVARMLRLPSQFFFHRYAGDVAKRSAVVEAIARLASGTVAALAIELTMSLLFLAAVFVYNPLLAVLVAALAVSNAILLRQLHRARREENQRMQRAQVLLSGIGMFGLRNIDTLKATAAEDDYFARWSGQQAHEFTARQKFAELGSVSAALPGLFAFLGSAAVLGLGSWQVISGELTVGMLLGLFALTGSVLRPIGRFVALVDELQILDANMRQVNDVMQAAEDEQFTAGPRPRPGKVATLGGRLRLAGRVEIRNVTFGYRRNRDPLIEDFSLSVEVGQRVAVIGPTGSGKSTLLKLLSGEFTPWSGEILFDGVPRLEIPREIISNSVAVVSQQVLLFSGTVRDNLTLWNPSVGDRQLADASKDALLHDEVMRRESGYESLVEEGGRNFSGGQRQRMEIARALVNNPAVLVLDEATSALDAASEALIDDALRRRGCTCVIVAQRMSTIRDCDLIVVMDRGHEVQRGVHEDLIADPQGLYSQLMRAQ